MNKRIGSALEKQWKGGRGKLTMSNFDFALGEIADMIRSSAERLSSERIAPLAAEIDANDWFPRELWSSMGALGPHGIRRMLIGRELIRA